MKNSIVNGNVYDIGQTINGISRFLYLNGSWHYFESRMSMIIEYSQEGLTRLVNDNDFDEIKLLGNIFEQFKQP
jgi:hypothetical protein